MGERYAPQAALLLTPRPLDHEAERAARLVDVALRRAGLVRLGEASWRFNVSRRMAV